ncbi:hypothetical protein FA95DRAFT_230568 [Auriscalpium vulgare]|uniref:Uncharacterized protein n=1 Tax=Auriscalpium vulgare TaxID=40419 RepID=A0ACB8RM05_9AGAM|nr:hypothetical protein FA95DRAFT_230568 [Auriscalpium vulgare]
MRAWARPGRLLELCAVVNSDWLTLDGGARASAGRRDFQWQGRRKMGEDGGGRKGSRQTRRKRYIYAPILSFSHGVIWGTTRCKSQTWETRRRVVWLR